MDKYRSYRDDGPPPRKKGKLSPIGWVFISVGVAAVLIAFAASSKGPNKDRDIRDYWGGGMELENHVGESFKGEGAVMDVKDATDYWMVLVSFGNGGRNMLLHKREGHPAIGEYIEYRCTVVRKNGSVWVEITDY